MENISSIFIIDSNENSREILKSFINEFGIVENIHSYSNYVEGIENIKKIGDNPIVFVDIADMEMLKAIKLYSTRIVIISTDYSTDSIIKAMRLGAKDFLPKPIIKEDLRRVLTILSTQNNEIEDSISKIITIYSNKGGIGKTTIAVNLASELAKITGDKVALIDLNLQLGDISTFLNLNPVFDVGYMIQNIINKRENNILNAFEKYKDTNLYILSDPNYIEQSESITPQQIGNMFNALRKVFPYIVVDMSSNIDANSLKILDSSDWILFTTIVNIPAIRNCQRCLNLFRSRKYPEDKVKLIINRYMENEEIKPEDIETTLGEKIYWKVPNNYFSIMDAINKGITVGEINNSSNITNSFKDLARKISDDIVEQAITKYNY